METGCVDSVVLEDLYLAVVINDLSAVEACLEELNINNISVEDYRKFVLHCIQHKRLECLLAILEHTSDLKAQFLQHEAELVQLEDAQTVLGETCLKFFDGDVVSVLADAGCKYISQDELRQFIICTINEDSSLENDVGNDSPTDTPPAAECTSEATSNEQDKIDTTLSPSSRLQCLTARFPNLHGNILKLVPSLPVQDLKPDCAWFDYYLIYGIQFFDAPIMTLLQLEFDDFESAKDSIMEVEPEKLDTHFKVYYPPTEAGSDWTLLSYAVSVNRIDIVKLLISRGAGVNEFCGTNWHGNVIYFTPFELAVQRDFTDICRVLVENGSNLHLGSTGPYGETLKNAIFNRNVEILEIILGSKQYPTLQLIPLMNDLSILEDDASVASQIRTVIGHCLRYGIRTKTTVAFAAMEKEDWQAATDMVAAMTTADIDAEVRLQDSEDDLTCTLLVYAVRMQKTELAILLVSKGVDVNHVCMSCSARIQDQYKTALCEAIKAKNKNLCHILIKSGAQAVVVQNGMRASALIALFNINELELVEIILHLCKIKPERVFHEFVEYFVDENSMNSFQLTKFFTVDVLKIIFSKGHALSESVWLMFLNTILHSVEADNMICLNLVKVLRNYLPVPMLTLKKALSKVLDETSYNRSRLRSLWEMARTVPSLQHMCRYAVRHCYTPFTEKMVQTFGVPVHMEEYLLEQSCSMGNI